MARFGLNNKKAYNNAFFCPDTRLHLTRSNPIGLANRVTPAILRGLKSQVIIDIDNLVDIEKGEFKKLVSQQDIVESSGNNQTDNATKQRGSKRKQSLQANEDIKTDKE